MFFFFRQTVTGDSFSDTLICKYFKIPLARLKLNNDPPKDPGIISLKYTHHESLLPRSWSLGGWDVSDRHIAPCFRAFCVKI